MFGFLLFSFISPVSATTSSNISSTVSYEISDGTILETVSFYNNSTVSTIYRREIHQNGTIDLYIDNVYHSSLNGANYNAFFALVGTSEVFYHTDVPSSIADFSTRTSNYGCGHNDKIHTYLFTNSCVIYRSDFANLGTAAAIAGILMQYFSVPYAALVAIAGVLLPNMLSDNVDRINIYEYEYDVYSVNNAYEFTCHHFSMLYYNYGYNGDTNQVQYNYISGDMYYTQTSRLS